jgi:hypothetical protein
MNTLHQQSHINSLPTAFKNMDTWWNHIRPLFQVQYLNFKYRNTKVQNYAPPCKDFKSALLWSICNLLIIPCTDFTKVLNINLFNKNITHSRLKTKPCFTAIQLDNLRTCLFLYRSTMLLVGCLIIHVPLARMWEMTQCLFLTCQFQGLCQHYTVRESTYFPQDNGMCFIDVSCVHIV